MKTEIVRIDDPSDSQETLLRAAEIIKNAGLVVFPTETVYGLGGDATNPDAAGKIYAAKGRPSDNPLIIHIASPEDAEKYTYVNETYKRLAECFMPGPLTVVLKARDNIPRKTRGGLDTVAVRCPENKIARELIRLSGVPIAAPSANLSGSPSPTSAKHAIEDMCGRVDMIIDGGESDIGVESTIVSVGEDGSLTLLRPGKITVEELSGAVGEVKIADAVTAKLREGEVALSPGMKYRHYAPKAELTLLDGDALAIRDYISTVSTDGTALLAYDEDTQDLIGVLPESSVFSFGKREDDLARAHMLFSLLRELDKLGFTKIYAPLPDRRGVGLALYNRMIRAAAHKIIKL